MSFGHSPSLSLPGNMAAKNGRTANRHPQIAIAHTSTPVVVLCSPHHGGLGVTRSLGRLGVPVFNVDSSRWAPAFYSRYCRGKFVWDLDETGPEESLGRLIEIARKTGRRCVLIPTTDHAALFVADYAAQLQKWYITPDASRVPVNSLCSKREMDSLAKEFGIPTARTFFAQTRKGLLEHLKNVGLPVMIKAVHVNARSRTGKTKWLVRTRPDVSALDEFLDRVSPNDWTNIIVQEYIPGGQDAVWIFNGYFNHDSECLLGFTGKKLRQCPIYTGVASLGVCHHNPIVENTAFRFVKAAGYRGIIDMDFCYDARDGLYKLVDVNPRIGSTFRLFVASDGMDVARALYLDLTGQPVPRSRASNGRKWIVEDLDLMASWRSSRHRKLTFRDWVRSLRGIREAAFFSWDDLLPVLAMLRADFKELFIRMRPRWDRPAFPFLGKNRAHLPL